MSDFHKIVNHHNEEIEIEYSDHNNTISIMFEHTTDFDFTELAYLELSKKDVSELIYALQDLRIRLMK